MKIIAIEGLDKSGKHSLSETLKINLESLGHKVAQMEFHNYDSLTGELVSKWLRGEYKVSQPTIELIMAADKQADQHKIQEHEDDGIDYLIIDRYILSQEVHALVKGMSTDFVMELQHYMRQPDATILLDIPAEVSIARKGKHNDGVNDKYEKDLEFLKDVRLQYLHHGTHNLVDNMHLIDGQLSYEDILRSAIKFINTL